MKAKIIVTIALITNIIVILNSIFRSVEVVEPELFGNILAVSIPTILSIIFLVLFLSKKITLNETQKNLLLVSYGLTGIVFFRWVLVHYLWISNYVNQ